MTQPWTATLIGGPEHGQTYQTTAQHGIVTVATLNGKRQSLYYERQGETGDYLYTGPWNHTRPTKDAR